MLTHTTIQLQGLKNINLRHGPDADPSDHYILKSVDGLGPPDITNAIAQLDSGGRYGGRQAAPKQLIFTIGLNPRWDNGQTALELREEIYKLLSTGYNPSVPIRLLNGDTPVAKTTGYVAHIDPDLFSKDPQIVLTMDTLDAYLHDVNPTHYGHNDIGGFRPVVVNPGTAEVGFQFAVKFTAARNKWFIKVREHQNIGMEFDFDFSIGDVLAVSTIPGSKYVHWNKHRGKVTNKMGILTNSSEWLTLHPDVNHFVVPKTGWVWKGPLQFTARWWGA